MPYQMKDGRWRAHKMIEGARKTKIFPTKTLAKKWEVGQNKEDWNVETDTIPTVCLHDVATAYLDYSKSRHIERTVEAKALAFRRFFVYISPDAKPEAVARKSVLDALTRIARIYGNVAANRVKKELSAFWSFGAKYHGFPLPSPIQQIEWFPESPEHHYVPPEEDFWKVYELADAVDRTMLLTFLHTAGRRSEILRLTWDDVDFKKRKIQLSTCKTRGGSRKQAWLTMTTKLYSALAEHKVRQGGRSKNVFLSKRTGDAYGVRRHFVRELCRRAGVRLFGYHGIRGLSATVLAQAGIPLPEIQKILRHAHMTTTERYIRSLGVTSDMLDAAFGKIDAGRDLEQGKEKRICT
jgi:integrase